MYRKCACCGGKVKLKRRHVHSYVGTTSGKRKKVYGCVTCLDNERFYQWLDKQPADPLIAGTKR